MPFFRPRGGKASERLPTPAGPPTLALASGASRWPGIQENVRLSADDLVIGGAGPATGGPSVRSNAPRSGLSYCASSVRIFVDAGIASLPTTCLVPPPPLVTQLRDGIAYPDY
jgi:hypothetical protein